MKDWFKHIIGEYQELLVWTPPLLVGILIAFKILPQLDPRSGLDGFGQLFAMMINAAGGIMVVFSAWLTKRTYFGITEPEDRAALSLNARIVGSVEWIVCFVLWYFVIFS